MKKYKLIGVVAELTVLSGCTTVTRQDGRVQKVIHPAAKVALTVPAAAKGVAMGLATAVEGAVVVPVALWRDDLYSVTLDGPWKYQVRTSFGSRIFRTREEADEFVASWAEVGTKFVVEPYPAH